MDDAFRRTVARFEGSVAIAAGAAAEPDQLYLALCGSGQSLYIGLAEDAFVVASEPYGLVEETARYVRMDGEATQGQVVALQRAGAGTVGGMRRSRYDGGPLPVDERDVITAEITTRDIDRADFHHFLLKELTEAPGSLRKTLRGKIVAGEDGRLVVRVGEDTVPPALARALAEGSVERVLVIGQGTAAVAGPGGGGRHRRAPARRLGGRPAGHRAVGFRALRRHEQHPDRRHQPVGHHHRHQPNRRPGSDPRRPRGGGGQSPQQRPGGQGPRSPLHLGRPGRRDERGLDEGVLCPGGRRLVAGRRAGRGRMRRAGLPRWPARSTGCCERCATCRRPCGRCWPDERRSAASPPPSPRPGATGRWSAADRIGWQPPRCASSCPSCATGPSPATPPRTRSTSTCPASR